MHIKCNKPYNISYEAFYTTAQCAVITDLLYIKYVLMIKQSVELS